MNPLRLTSVTLKNLPSKFYPNLLGHEKCTDPLAKGLKEKICDAFEKNNPDGKNTVYIEGLDGNPLWMMKAEYEEGIVQTPDTHIYSIRKAEKISLYIKKLGLEKLLAVPKKFLYYNEQTSRFYTISQYLELSDTTTFLNSQQAKSLSELSVLGYTNYDKLFFTKSGQVALIDTKPTKRVVKKALSLFTNRVLIDKDSILTMQALNGMAKLKAFCLKDALQEVEKAEKNTALWGIALSLSRLAITCLALSFIPNALLPFSGILAVSLKVYLCARALMVTLELTGISIVWGLSCANRDQLRHIEKKIGIL